MRTFVWAVTVLMSVRAIYGFFLAMESTYPRVETMKFRSSDVIIVLMRLAAIGWALHVLGVWGRP